MQRGIPVIVSLLGLLLLAAGLYLIILGPTATMPQVGVARIQPGDQEVAWLHPATNIATWERFVAGIKELPGITVDESAAFPEESMKLPVIGIRKANTPGTLWIRWYKLTDSRTIERWVNELCRRDPPPLAMVGGGNSERARDIATQLHRLEELKVASLPIFLITTATADQVKQADGKLADLIRIYPERTFRFCYTNKQMAEAISDFVRRPLSQERSVQITSQRISLLSWQDDPFSEDLVNQFQLLWRRPAASTPNPTTWSYRMGHSVGGLNQPNKTELAGVHQLMQEANTDSFAVRGRELLVLPGGPSPARRVLRTLYRTDPIERNFWVVTVGDAIDWNTLYRDRRLTWSIEDVPFPLIAFMHRNPVDQQLSVTRSFIPEVDSKDPAQPTGTDDLLLYRDIGHSLIQSFDGSLSIANAQIKLKQSLLAERDAQGKPLFDEYGNRRGGGGEFITLLQPLYHNLQVLPRSKIEVFERQTENQSWKAVISLEASYDTSSSSKRGQP